MTDQRIASPALNRDNPIDGFVGRYNLTRRVGPNAGFIGEARIEPTPHSAGHTYTEIGALWLRRDGETRREEFSASRQYQLEWANGTVRILFITDPSRMPGSVFQTLTFRRRGPVFVASGKHWCAPDSYASKYIISDTGIVVSHRVDGPRKSYVSVSRMTRL